MIDVELRPAGARRFLVAMRAVLVGGLAVALAACAGGAGKNDDDVSEILEQRAMARWQMIIEGKGNEAYAYLTPGYRSTHSEREYARSVILGAIKWNKATWQDAECSAPDACKAKVMVDYSVRMPGAGDVPSFRLMQESWLLIDGEWYFLPES